MGSVIRNSITKLLLLALATAISLFVMQLIHVAKASAYDNGRLIDNTVFLDAKSMSAGQIQSFLVSKGSGLANMNFVLQCYGSDSQERAWYTAAGATCDTPIPASHIIYYAAQIYGINPKVVLATMQKEQSLTTAPNPASWQLNQAMGYACPTSGNCEGTSSFPYQIDSGTWALRWHYERANGNLTWWRTSTSWTCGTEKKYYKPNLYPGQNVRFYDEADRHYTTFHMYSAATSALYCYTPHAYNNFPGCIPVWGVSYTSERPVVGNVGNCYSGSYNFVYWFEVWFGSTLEDTPGAIYRLYNKNTNNHLYTTSVSERDRAASQYNFQKEGVAFIRCQAGGKDIYRLYNARNGRHLFTASASERDKANSQTNFKYEGVAFKACGSKEVYRLYSAREQKHFYTTSVSERNKLVNNTSFVYEGVVFTVN